MSFLSFLGAQFSTKKTMMAGRVGCPIFAPDVGPRSQSICCFNCVVRDMFGPQIVPKKSTVVFQQRGGKRVRFFTGSGSGIYIWVFPNIVDFPPKSSILIRFSIIFTLHFGCFTRIFGNTHIIHANMGRWYCCKLVDNLVNLSASTDAKKGNIVSSQCQIGTWGPGQFPLSKFSAATAATITGAMWIASLKHIV